MRTQSDEITAYCPAFGKCGACDMLDIAYEEQIARKFDVIAGLFPEAAHDGKISPVLGMDDPFHYRNKIIAPFAPGKGSGKERCARKARSKGGSSALSIRSGMYAKGTHDIIPTESCLLENEVAASIVKAIMQLMKKWHILPYDEDKGTGFLRHAVIRAAHNSNEVLVVLVTNSEEFPSSKSFCRELVKRVPQITSVVQNINTRSTNVILGERFKTLYGPGFILDKLCGLSFRISPGSFYQVNAAQTEVLYEQAVKMAKLSESQVVVDAYCGTGTIGLCAADAGARKVIGFDAVEKAIADARQNAKHNGIENASFYTCDAAQFMDREIRHHISADDEVVLFMDPPRSGSDVSFLSSAVDLAPSRIVYISCNPKTQQRDVAFLTDYGYGIDDMVPVDMFPHTDHIENIIALVRDH